jgi:hypothetical protein
MSKKKQYTKKNTTSIVLVNSTHNWWDAEWFKVWMKLAKQEQG